MLCLMKLCDINTDYTYSYIFVEFFDSNNFLKIRLSNNNCYFMFVVFIKIKVSVKKYFQDVLGRA